MKYNGIIFDFNGTLLWDTEFHIKSWNRISLEIRGKPFTPEEFKFRIYGMTNDSIVKYLMHKPVDDKTLCDIASKKEQLYRSFCLSNPDKFKLAVGAADFLDFLKKKGMPIAIATASGLDNVKFYIDHFNLYKWFKPANIIYDDHSFPGKPAPDIYLKAAGRLDILPVNCTVFEDSIAGLQAARSAGIGRIIAVLHDSRESLRNKASGIDLIIHDFREISPDSFLDSNRGQ